MLIDDRKEYKEKLRGMYFDIEKKAPGPIVYTSEELEDAIVNIDRVDSETGDLRRRFREEFHQYECANSSQRIFDEVMKDTKVGLLSRILGKIFP